MSLAEDLHRILKHFHLTHVPTLTNQGCASAVEHHLAQLAAVAGDVQRGDEAAMKVLGELYGATVPTSPASEAAPVVTAESIVSPSGLTAGSVIPADAVIMAPPEPVPAEPVPADVAEAAHAAVEEASAPAEPQGTEAA